LVERAFARGFVGVPADESGAVAEAAVGDDQLGPPGGVAGEARRLDGRFDEIGDFAAVGLGKA
jgi:hypothetical protein